MFDGLVDRYDLANDILSFGLDRWWRRAAARSLEVSAGDLILDLGCGTGALGSLLAGRARVVGLDVSRRMILRARAALGSGSQVCFVQGSAFRLPFPEGTFQGAASGFVLRNLDDLPAAFSELHRVLAPGATISLVDLTDPPSPAFRRLFRAYFAAAAPAVGSLLGKRDDYRYLVRSLAQLPEPSEVCRLLRVAGFERVRARPLTGGTATLFTARKGREPVAGEVR